MSLFKAALPALAVSALALGACSQEAEETTYEVDAEDMGGGELQVSDTQEDAVDVDLPETPMVNVPEEGEAEGEGEMGEQ